MGEALVKKSYRELNEFGEACDLIFLMNLHGLDAKIKKWREIWGERPPLIYRDDHLISL